MPQESHPTIAWYREQAQHEPAVKHSEPTDPELVATVCTNRGAADVGCVELERPALDGWREDILRVFPQTRTLVGLVFPLNRTSLRTVEHSIANIEFHHAYGVANQAAREIVRDLDARGIPALNTPIGFPYNTDRWPGAIWFVPDKIVATEAGLGKMGLNRLVLHPRLGSCVVLATLLIGVELSAYHQPLDYDPCVECKLCVSACPTGAIASDGYFDFMSCYNHNYREKLGGFQAWVENVVQSRSVKDYRNRVQDRETVSMWQNLSICPQTRCDRCMAVCPAGRDAIGDFVSDRKTFVQHVVKPFKALQEEVYVVQGSDGEEHVVRHEPHKTPRLIANGIRPGSIAAFERALPVAFQRHQARGLDATYHFSFTGHEERKLTVVIRNQTIQVNPGHVGSADLHIVADSRTWTAVLAKEAGLPWAILRRKIRIKGPIRLMKAFAKCFPA